MYSQIQQSTQYWGERTSFHFNFKDDWKYALGADKFGHAFAANVIASSVQGGLAWSGIDTTSAVWYGFGAAMFYQTLVEIRDGFSKGKNGEFAPYLGFSWGDMAGNFLGASLPLAQHYVPVFQNIRYKYSLNPSNKIREGGYYSSITDDYESEYHWLSINVFNLLPTPVQKFWTPLLNIAIGHSVKDIVDAPARYTYNGYHELWISLDYNLEAIPGDAAWWKSLKKILNFYKLPAPCMRVLPSVVWYGMRL